MSISRNLSDVAARLWWEEVEGMASSVRKTGEAKGVAVRAQYSIGFERTPARVSNVKSKETKK